VAAVALGWGVAWLGARMARRRMMAGPSPMQGGATTEIGAGNAVSGAAAGAGLRRAVPVLALGLHSAALAGVLAVLGWVLAGLPPASGHAQSALTAVLLWYGAVHAAAGLLMSLFLMLRWASGFVSARHRVEPQVVWLFGHYSLGSTLLCMALAAAPALLA